MKKTISIVLFFIAIGAIFFAFTISSFANEKSGYLTYKIKDGEAIITDCDTSASGKLAIPETLGGCPVTGIGYQAFYNCRLITEIVIPKGVAEIGAEAFRDCSELKNVSIPESVNYIGNYAFKSTSIENVYITDIHKWYTIDFDGYESNPLRWFGNLYINGELAKDLEIEIPEGTKRIGDYAFYGIEELKSITIPESVTSIGENAFSRVEEVHITDIHKWVTIDFQDNPLSKFGAVLYVNGQSIEEFEIEIRIPEGTKRIGEYAFCGFKTLKNIIIPDSVTAIGGYAFYGCSSLENIAIPDNVMSIGEYAFYGCASLENISIPDGISTIGFGSFVDCVSLKNVAIPDSVTIIETDVFSGCNSLTNVYITDIDKWCSINFHSVSSNPFRHAKNLYLKGKLVTDLEVVIPNGTEKIGNYAFYGFKTLKSITIPDSVTTIGYESFYDCSSLESITIPDSVTSIGSRAFYGCSSLENIVLPNRAIDIGIGAFLNTAYLNNVDNWEDGVLYIGKHLVAVAHGTSYGYDLQFDEKEYKIKDGTITIIQQAFHGCRSLESITIPDSVRKIGWRAFAGTAYCENVNSWEDGVLYIGNHLIEAESSLSGEYKIKDGTLTIADCAFSDCHSLKSFTIPDSIKAIGECVFYSSPGVFSNYYLNISLNIADLSKWFDIDFFDSRLKYTWLHIYRLDIRESNLEIFIPNGTQKIDSYEFFGFTGSKKVVIPDGVTTIGDYAFAYCSSLESITIPDSVTSIGDYAFSDCNSLESITIPDSVTSIDDYAFSDCLSLKSIIIPDSVTSIGDYAFYNCNSLESIIIPDSVTSIGDYAFSDCESLESIIIPDSVTSIGDYAFSDCESLESVTIPDSVTSLGVCAFLRCSSLESVTIPDSATTIGDGVLSGCTSLKKLVAPEFLINRLSTHSAHKKLLYFDNYSHYYRCYMCGLKSDEADHNFDNRCDRYCNDCEYYKGELYTHYYVFAYSSEEHWYSCYYCGETTDYEEHDFVNAEDENCDTCGYFRGCTHSFKTEWSTDEKDHWLNASIVA